jgi:hypothetical protein
MGWARAFANRAFTETIAVPDGHGNGHGHANGHGAVTGGEHAAVGPGTSSASSESGEAGSHEGH